MNISRVVRLGIAAVVCLFAHVPVRRGPGHGGTVHRHRRSIRAAQSVPGATVVVKNERTGEERTATSNAAGPLRGDRPEALGLHDQASTLRQLRAARVHRACSCSRRRSSRSTCSCSRRASPKRSRSTAQPTTHRPQLGAHRRQRQRARSAEPAGQRPADVAADAAGARLAELRHRHLEGRAVQRPRRSSRTPSATTASRARRSSTRRPATSTARSRRRSSCRRASRTCRSSASSRTTTRPSSAPAPAAR